MGFAIADAGIRYGHQVTAILGPIALPFPEGVNRIDVETAAEMSEAVGREFAQNDLLIMAAAVADFRPKLVASQKLERKPGMILELEPTEDILATVSRHKRPDQRTIGFSLQSDFNLETAQRKLIEKNLDLIVHNPVGTIAADEIEATLIYPDGRRNSISPMPKKRFGEMIIRRAMDLF